MSTPASLAIRPANGGTSIKDLPVELLSIIFSFAVLKYSDDEDFLRLDRSRRTLCSVCSLWRAIVVSLPKLWTVIVNFVDVHTDCMIAGDQLTLSRNLPLSLILTRCFEASIQEIEGALGQAMLMLAMPHFSRLERLHFDVHFSSSLPSIEKHFLWSMPSLITLALKSDCDDGPYKEHEAFNDLYSRLSMLRRTIPLGKFSCPLLDTMTLDGANFRYICQERPEWTYNLENLDHLTVSHCTENEEFDVPRLELHDVSDFLCDLPQLHSVTFEAVDFYFDPHDPPNQSSLDNIMFLELKGIHGQCLTDLFSNYDLEDLDTVTITDCILEGQPTFPLFCRALNLKGVDAAPNLSSFIQRWEFSVISFTNCSELNDDVLDALGSTHQNHPSRFRVEGFNKLILRSCSNFSIGALKRLVERRNCSVDYTDPNWWRKVKAPEIKSIVVRRRGLELSVADRQWFESRLCNFFWNGVGCRRELL